MTMDFNTIWFLLIGVLLVGYAVLDGFDLGVGVLHLFARRERHRRLYLAAIGPVWDGNEVWLLTAGGALFAAFPLVYATVFSGFYLAFMLLLFALIFRAVAIEFRGQVDSRGWRRAWDWAFGLGSLLPAVLFGVALGNVVRGLPIESDGSLNVAFIELLNPYALLVGLLSLAMCAMQGGTFLTARTDGALQERLARWTAAAWTAFVLLWLLTTLATFFAAPAALERAMAAPLAWVALLMLLVATVYVPIAIRSGEFVRALVASSAAIGSLIGLMGLSLYPVMVPSTVDAANSLTIYNAASTPGTLKVMLVLALLGMPLVILYTAYVYRVFMGKVLVEKNGY